MPMQLSQWLSTRKMTDAEFGALVGKDQATISRTKRGVTMPGPALVAKIAEVTDGEVTVSDLYAAYTGRASAHSQPERASA